MQTLPERRGPPGGAAGETLEQLGWFDQGRRLLTLRLTEQQWQTVQQAVLRASAEPGAAATAEELLAACLRQWLDAAPPQEAATSVEPGVFLPPADSDGNKAEADDANAVLAQLDAWLAAFGADTLFTVTVRRPLRSRPARIRPTSDTSGENAPQSLQTVEPSRDEQHRQVHAAGVRRLVQRHGARVRRIEPETIGAAAWSEAIDNWGTCE